MKQINDPQNLRETLVKTVVNTRLFDRTTHNNIVVNRRRIAQSNKKQENLANVLVPQVTDEGCGAVEDAVLVGPLLGVAVREVEGAAAVGPPVHVRALLPVAVRGNVDAAAVDL